MTIALKLNEESLAANKKNIYRFLTKTGYQIKRPLSGSISRTDLSNPTLALLQKHDEQIKQSFYDIIFNYVEKDVKDRNTISEVKCYESFEDFLTTFVTFAEQLRTEFDYDRRTLQAKNHDLVDELTKLNKEKAFINTYALFGAAVVAKERLEGLVLPQENLGGTLNRIDPYMEPDKLKGNLSELVVRAINDLSLDKSQQLTDSVLVNFFDAFYSCTINSAQADKKNFKDIITEKGIDGLSVELNGTTIKGFEYSTGSGTENFKSDVTFDDIVGNTELISTLKSLADNYLLFYNAKTKSNPVNSITSYPTTYLLKGRPGTGKTTAIKAFVGYMQEKCEEKGQKFDYINIGQDIKSKYFGESVQNMKKKFELAAKGDSVCLITIEDIDAVFAARESMKEDSPERDILQELMNTLEGVLSNKNGNFILLATTNRPASLDGALAERLKQNEVIVSGPETKEDYARLFQILLKQGLGKFGYIKDKSGEDHVQISQERWTDLGALCLDGQNPSNLELSLSGGAVRNITTRLTSETMKYVKIDASKLTGEPGSDEWCQSYAEQIPKITSSDIENTIKQYKEQLLVDEEMKYKERLKERVDSIVSELRASVAAQDDGQYRQLQSKAYELERRSGMEAQRAELANTTYERTHLEAMMKLIEDKLAQLPLDQNQK